MDSQQLIQLVRAHVELFDLAHPKYLDVSHKEKLWQEIGQELDQSAANCKSRWNNIRDNYRKHLRKIVNKHGTAPTNMKPYKFSEQLNFLKKYLQVSETVNTSTYKEPVEIKEEPIDIEHHPRWDLTPSELKQLIECDDSNIEMQETTEEIEQNNAKIQKSRKRPFSAVLPTPKGKIQPKQGETASSTLMKYLLEKKDREDKAYPQQHDAIDAFLASLSPTLRTFSPYYLNLAKTKIFNIVQEYELKMMEETDKKLTSFSPSLSLSPSSEYSYSSPPVGNSSSAVLNPSNDPHHSFVPTDYATSGNSVEERPQTISISEEFEENSTDQLIVT